CGVARQREPGAVAARHEVRERSRDDPQAMRPERELLDDPPLQQAHRVARDGIAEAGIELFRDRRAADLGVPLEHADGDTGGGEIARADEAVVAAADDYHIEPCPHAVRPSGASPRPVVRASAPTARTAADATAPECTMSAPRDGAA